MVDTCRLHTGSYAATLVALSLDARPVLSLSLSLSLTSLSLSLYLSLSLSLTTLERQLQEAHDAFDGGSLCLAL